MKSILSTKKMTEPLRQLLLKRGFILEEYEAIRIDPIQFNIPLIIENAIFTSQNSVKALQNSIPKLRDKIQNCFCVGPKTKTLLETQNLKVVKMARDASKLAKHIAKNHKKESFHFFRGNFSRDIIPSTLKKHGIPLVEIEVYKTTHTPKNFNQKFDGILFFSPSGVQSFMMSMSDDNNGVSAFSGTAFCIGMTTASEAKKHFENVEISSETTVESIIEKVVETLKEI